MKFLESSVSRRVAWLWLGTIAAILSCTTAQSGCEFATVKQQIDRILDRDAEKATKFRREVADGADSITMIESLVPPEMAKMIDVCRFETAEYLTKRGFPPFH